MYPWHNCIIKHYLARCCFIKTVGESLSLTLLSYQLQTAQCFSIFFRKVAKTNFIDNPQANPELHHACCLLCGPQFCHLYCSPHFLWEHWQRYKVARCTYFVMIFPCKIILLRHLIGAVIYGLGFVLDSMEMFMFMKQ